VEGGFEKGAIGDAVQLPIDLVDAPRSPRMHRWIDVIKSPFIRRQLAVRMHVPLAQHNRELIFRELSVDVGQRQAVESQVPGGEPGVLPRVGDGQDMRGVEVPPAGVACASVFVGRRAGGVAGKPLLDSQI
jgi:hypothetical protein